MTNKLSIKLADEPHEPVITPLMVTFAELYGRYQGLCRITHERLEHPGPFNACKNAFCQDGQKMITKVQNAIGCPEVTP